ncbi:Sec1 domain containing protein 1, variant 2 [Bonamia ostreae]
MLNLNKNGKSDKIWKVLIIDITGREIISPLFNLNEIRSFGVTLLLLSNSKKEAVSDAISIYFVEPNKENIDNILNDLMEDLYREYYLNFVSSISKEMLSYLAKKSLELGVSDKIKSVYDQFSHFQCLEKRLFSLSIKNSFSKMIKNDQNLAKRIVNGLFDIFVTIKEVPIIKAAKGSMAENIGRKLAEKIRSRSERNEDLFPKKKFGFSFKRTLLILVDRQIDISTMLHHTSTYQALVHDLLNYQNHQVSLEREDFLKNQKTNSTTFELNENDHFWIENKGLPFMDVASL